VGKIGHGLQRWITALKDRRETARKSLPLVAYYWNGSTPEAYPVKGVSLDGAYVVTPDQWYMGTILRLTFQYPGAGNGNGNGNGHGQSGVGADPEYSRVVRAKLVRQGPDGIGVRLLFLNPKERKSFKKFLATVEMRKRAMEGHAVTNGDGRGVQ
jgi:hypothetical protein